jgi:hypothetical protein
MVANDQAGRAQIIKEQFRLPSGTRENAGVPDTSKASGFRLPASGFRLPVFGRQLAANFVVAIVANYQAGKRKLSKNNFGSRRGAARVPRAGHF